MTEALFSGAEVSREDSRSTDYIVDRLTHIFRDIRRISTDSRVTERCCANSPTAAESPVRSASSYSAWRAAACSTGRSLGLMGSYYQDRDFHSLVYRHRDPTIAFDWGPAGPVGLPTDNFSIRWEGPLDVPAEATYTFYLDSDDGSRLFIDGSQVVDNWNDHARETREGSVRLSPGRHAIRLDYYEASYDALVQLSWSSPAFARRQMNRWDFR